MFRLSTCTCKKCELFEYNKCERDDIHGKWVNHCITRRSGSEQDEAEYDSCEDDKEVEFNVSEDEYDSADDEIEENEKLTDIVQLGNADFKLEEFLIVQVSKTQYICEVWDISDSSLTCKFMRRDFSHLDIGTMRFKWPVIEDIGYVDLNNILGTLTKYLKTRRGGLIVHCCLKDKFKNLN